MPLTMSQDEMAFMMSPRSETGEMGGELIVTVEVVDASESRGILEVFRDAITPAGEAALCDEQRAAGASDESTDRQVTSHSSKIFTLEKSMASAN